jgi:hypothetical protein
VLLCHPVKLNCPGGPSLLFISRHSAVNLSDDPGQV